MQTQRVIECGAGFGSEHSNWRADALDCNGVKLFGLGLRILAEPRHRPDSLPGRGGGAKGGLESVDA